MSFVAAISWEVLAYVAVAMIAGVAFWIVFRAGPALISALRIKR